MRADDFFAGKKVTLMGLGLLGRGVGDARFMAAHGAELIVTDLKSAEQLASSVEQLRDFSNITFRLGEHRLEDFAGRDLIVKAAGVPQGSPYIAEAKKHGTPVRMSADLFAELAGVPVVGITGTRGKSTTTHLVAHILRTAGRQVVVGGNVRGISTLELLPEVGEQTLAVLELDSWQLQGFGEAKMSPQVSIFTTFYPDHMNYYQGDMRAYFADKAQIFLNQQATDTLVLGEQVAPFVKEYGYGSKIRAQTHVVGANDLPKSITLKIPGEHNRYNAALAATAARALGTDEAAIAKALASFEGVEGRLQYLGEVRGVRVYNDNNSTTPDATLAALRALATPGEHKLVLIMGGSDKGLTMGPLLNLAQQTCKKILFLAGAGTDRILSELPKDYDAMIYHNLEEAVAAAFAASAPGDTLLFSPAFASFGMFTNEYDRNDQFVAAINARR